MDKLDNVQSLRTLVFERLRQLIMSGALKRGSHLSEPDLAHKLGTSRGPVREALQMLYRDGWVELRPRQGAFVRNPPAHEVDDFFAVKGMLEAEAARLAAANATADDITALEELLPPGDKAAADDDPEQITELSTRFHLGIARASGNAILSEMLESLERRLRFYFLLVSGVRNEESWKEHATVVAALRRGDADTAARVMREHSDATHASYRIAFPDGDS